MTDKPDPLVQSLMALAVSAAPLIERARASGLFKPGTREAAASEVAATPAEPADTAQKSALQDIIVAQAIKIQALETELAKLKAQP